MWLPTYSNNPLNVIATIAIKKVCARLQFSNSRKRCSSSLVNLHIKNPIAFAMKDTIVNVSALIQGARCDKPRGTHSG